MALPSRRNGIHGVDLRPTMGKVAAAHGIDLSQAGVPEMSITEVHRLVH
jgi:hypothetical protein